MLIVIPRTLHRIHRTGQVQPTFKPYMKPSRNYDELVLASYKPRCPLVVLHTGSADGDIQVVSNCRNKGLGDVIQPPHNRGKAPTLQRKFLSIRTRVPITVDNRHHSDKCQHKNYNRATPTPLADLMYPEKLQIPQIDSEQNSDSQRKIYQQ